MSDDFVGNEADFQDLVSCAREIVLPGAAGVRIPGQRSGAWYDVTADAVTLTDGLSTYGSC